ncbi:MAG: acetoin dehydrogenase dihydrolipoyllysine-residue acetyltransferase subunit [Azospirillaceae bacterium]
MSDAIQPIVMPKWGLAMQEGMVAQWHVEEGSKVSKGDEIMDIETSKIANIFESPVEGKLRRKVADDGETLPVGALMGVVAEDSVSDDDIDAFVKDFQEAFAEQMAAMADGGGAEPETVEVGGHRIRYLKMGDADGPAVIFVHGFGGDLWTWMFNQEAAAEGHATYAIDLPGHGGSSKEMDGADVAALSKAVSGFMDAMGIEKAHLVGHSLGGAVSLNLAVTGPDKVASVTLVCPAGLGPDINMEYIEGFIREKRGKKLKPFLEMLVADPEIVTRDMVEDVLKYKRMDGVEAALNALSSANFSGGAQALDLSGKLGDVSAPVQVIWGKQDKIVPAKHAEAVPSSVKVTIFDDAGHLAHMEKSAETNALIKEIAG